MASQTLTEWSEARAIIGRFDNNLHDLRKYGFSFVTAILTADAILSHNFSSAAAEITWYEKWAVLFVTVGLILALRLLDQQYRLFQRAADQRAIILEERMSIDLTEDFGTLYKLGGWRANIENLYDSFLALTFVLGFAILFPNYLGIIFLALLVLVSSYLREAINGMDLEAAMDWSVDSAATQAGTPLRIILTNLDRTLVRDQSPARLVRMYMRWTGPARRAMERRRAKRRAKHPAKEVELADAQRQKMKVEKEESLKKWIGLRTWSVAWVVFSEKGDVVDWVLREIVLDYSEHIDWLWDTTGASPGLYTLQMYCYKDEIESDGTFRSDRIVQILK